MEWYWSLSLMLGVAISAMLLGVPVAFAFLTANIVGAIVFFGADAGVVHLCRNFLDAVGSFQLVPVTMFVLMGELLFHSGMAMRAINAIDRLFPRIPGRLSIVAISGGTMFSALSGSTMANTAMLGSTLVPEMRRRGYAKSMAIGPILATGGIAMLIPPSNLAVLLGSLADISIAGLLLAGAVPGLLLACIHVTYVLIRCSLDPKLAPEYDIVSVKGWERLRPLVVYVIPLSLLFVLVIGSILAGFATPSESATLGVAGALLLGFAYRSLDLARLRKAVEETLSISVMIFFIIAASLTFSQILSFSGATEGLLGHISGTDVSSLVLVTSMIALVLLLGCIMDPLSIMLVTLPFFVPLVDAAGIHPVWFGVLMLLALEIGQTTPPFGLLLFVMKGIVADDVSMRDIYFAILPFMVLELVILVLLLLLPGLVTWLPTSLLR